MHNMTGRVTYARCVFDRRELLRALGVAGASTIVAACGGRSRVVRQKPQIRDEVRTWLRDAVAKLAAVYPGVHVLAVSRRRTTAGIDIVGTGITRGRRDGVVLAVRDRDGGQGARRAAATGRARDVSERAAVADRAGDSR